MGWGEYAGWEGQGEGTDWLTPQLMPQNGMSRVSRMRGVREGHRLTHVLAQDSKWSERQAECRVKTCLSNFLQDIRDERTGWLSSLLKTQSGMNKVSRMLGSLVCPAVKGLKNEGTYRIKERTLIANFLFLKLNVEWIKCLECDKSLSVLLLKVLRMRELTRSREGRLLSHFSS